MQFSESWLRTLVNPSLSSEELSHLLTMAGLEVEDRISVAPVFDKVVVAQVLTKDKHPDADRLNILTVDVGQAEALTIVCGAQNVSVGMKAPCALIGAKLPGIEIKQAKVRGTASFGMMCSQSELGLAKESSGLMELSPEAIVGMSIRDHLDLDDHLFTIKLTPNRSDCLSMLGIAREISALTGAPVQDLKNAEPKLHDIPNRKISLTASKACPRYIGRVISGVNAQAMTPAWMVQRLERCGLRSISALVDVTNYVLLERGQPLHAFDLNKLNGNIEIRFARLGETLKLLNDQVVELQEDMLVIADEMGAVALAGVMGGADSAVDEATTTVFLESAFFQPSTIAGKARLLGFSSDSSYRFERGVDFSGTAAALDRATQLILEICGGEASPYTEQLGDLPVRHPVKLRLARVHRVLGIDIQSAEIAKILQLLGMGFRQHADDFQVTPPSYRFDIQIEEDLIEEVARVHGYEKIVPSPTLARTTVLPLAEGQRPITKLRHGMVVRDYQEAINYAFVEAGWERDLCGNTSPVLLRNPIASQMSVMRSSLLGGLLSTLSTNLARKQPRVRLFEIGGCFAKEAGGYVQSERLAGLAYGGAVAEQWGVPARAVDFYDVKGDVEALFAPCILSFKASVHPASHPGRSARIILDGKEIGWIGELHPQWQQKYEIPQSVIWFEVDILAATRRAVPMVTEISRFPPVRRDIAIQVDEAVTAESLLRAMYATKDPKVVEISLFDQYRGKGVEPGKKSLAFRVLLQDTKKTLTDSEIEPSIAILVTALQKNGAQLRS